MHVSLGEFVQRYFPIFSVNGMLNIPVLLYCIGHGDHWSDLIGASHTKDYTIWKQGGYASMGVQRVAEWGSTTTLEREILTQVIFWEKKNANRYKDYTNINLTLFCNNCLKCDLSVHTLW